MVRGLNKQEKKIEEQMAIAIPLMDSFEKGYILGLLEGRVREREMEERKSKEKQLSKT